MSKQKLLSWVTITSFVLMAANYIWLLLDNLHNINYYGDSYFWIHSGYILQIFLYASIVAILLKNKKMLIFPIGIKACLEIFDFLNSFIYYTDGRYIFFFINALVYPIKNTFEATIWLIIFLLILNKKFVLKTIENSARIINRLFTISFIAFCISEAIWIFSIIAALNSAYVSYDSSYICSIVFSIINIIAMMTLKMSVNADMLNKPDLACSTQNSSLCENHICEKEAGYTVETSCTIYAEEGSANKYTPKRLILLSTSFVIAILNFITLVFNIVHINIEVMGTAANSKVNGFSVLTSYPAAITETGDWLSIYSVIHLILSIIILVTLVICLVKKTSDSYLFIAKATNAFSFVMSIIYFINGLIALSEAKDGVGPIAEVITAAFWPLIIIGILAIAHIIVEKFIPEEFNHRIYNNNNVHDVEYSMSLITKYKDLLDQGIITQEEFDAKKKQLLGL